MPEITQEKSELITEKILTHFSNDTKDDVTYLVKNGINCGRNYRHIAADICREIGREAETKNIRKIAKILRNDFPEGER